MLTQDVDLLQHLPSAGELGTRLERVSGPFHGYFLASYAVRWLEGYVGYVKICAAPPTSVWECDARQKVSSQMCDRDEDALDAAELIAKLLITQGVNKAATAPPAQ